jgi:hypothetical protein
LVFNKLSEFDHLPFTQALPLHKSSRDQNVPQSQAGAYQNVSPHQQVNIVVAKWFMEAIVFTKTPGPVLSNIKYNMVE